MIFFILNLFVSIVMGIALGFLYFMYKVRKVIKNTDKLSKEIGEMEIGNSVPSTEKIFEFNSKISVFEGRVQVISELLEAF